MGELASGCRMADSPGWAGARHDRRSLRAVFSRRRDSDGKKQRLSDECRALQVGARSVGGTDKGGQSGSMAILLKTCPEACAAVGRYAKTNSKTIP